MATKNQNIYVMATYVARPKNPMQTSQKGYMSNPDNVEYDEHISMSKGFKDKFNSNHVILDITDQKVVKNSFNANRNFEDIFGHFMQNYEDHIKNGLQQLTGININSDLENTPINATVPRDDTPAVTGMKSDGLSST